MYYAIADIHGRFDLLDKALTAISNDAIDNNILNYTIITLGDYIDRGPQSKDVIDTLMNHDSDHFICLQGNHEAMMVDTITKPLDSRWWTNNGGYATIKSYNPDAMPWETSWVDQRHVKWCASLPRYYETDKHVFVHAGIPSEDLSLEDQDITDVYGQNELQWMLYTKGEKGGYRGKHVVHGHLQFEDGPHEYELRTDLDCWAVHTGRLVVGVFSPHRGKAVKYLEVFGDDYGSKGRQDLGERLLQSA